MNVAVVIVLRRVNAIGEGSWCRGREGGGEGGGCCRCVRVCARCVWEGVGWVRMGLLGLTRGVVGGGGAGDVRGAILRGAGGGEAARAGEVVGSEVVVR